MCVDAAMDANEQADPQGPEAFFVANARRRQPAFLECKTRETGDTQLVQSGDAVREQASQLGAIPPVWLSGL